MVTEADSSCSVPEMVSVISPISPLKLDIYYDTNIRGCAKRCPCRIWTNCHYYNSSRWKKLRGDEELLFEEIHEWYENFFKHNHGLPDATYPNG